MYYVRVCRVGERDFGEGRGRNVWYTPGIDAHLPQLTHSRQGRMRNHNGAQKSKTTRSTQRVRKAADQRAETHRHARTHTHTHTHTHTRARARTDATRESPGRASGRRAHSTHRRWPAALPGRCVASRARCRRARRHQHTHAPFEATLNAPTLQNTLSRW